MTDAVKLKPCPFCGGNDLSTGGDDKFVGVFCKTCKVTGPNHYGSLDWNTRAEPAPAPDAVKIEPVGYLSERGVARLNKKYSAAVHPERAFKSDTALYGHTAMDRIKELEAENERHRYSLSILATTLFSDNKYLEYARRALTGGQKDG